MGKLRKSYSVSQLLDGIEKRIEKVKDGDVISSTVATTPNISLGEKVELKKQRIDIAKRKEILQLNSRNRVSLKEYSKLYELHEKARQLE